MTELYLKDQNMITFSIDEVLFIRRIYLQSTHKRGIFTKIMKSDIRLDIAQINHIELQMTKTNMNRL